MSTNPDKTAKIIHITCYILLIACFILTLNWAHTHNIWIATDMWWMISTGNEIINDGIPYFNTHALLPSDIHQTPAIIVQQWLYCLIIAGFTNTFGMKAGIITLVLIQWIAALTLLIFAMRKLSHKQLPTWVIVLLLSITSYALCEWTLQPRPQAITMLILIGIVLILEHYKETRNAYILIALPVLTMIHVNIHASMAPTSLAVICLYVVVQTIREKKLSAPLTIACLAAILTTLITPYNIGSILYSALSYDAAAYGDIIQEMKSVTSGGIKYCLLFTINVLLTSFAIYCAIKSKARTYELIIICVIACIAGFINMRSLWMSAPCCLLLLATPNTNQKMQEMLQQTSTLVLCFMLALIIPLMCAASINVVPSLEQQLDEASDVKTIITNAGENSAITLFASGNILEYSDLKVSSDGRPELWEPNLSKINLHIHHANADILKDAIAITRNNDTSADTYTNLKQNLNNYLTWYDCPYFVNIQEQNMPCIRQVLDELGWTLVYDGEYIDMWQRAGHLTS